MNGVDISEFIAVESKLYDVGFLALVISFVASVVFVIVCIVARILSNRSSKPLAEDKYSNMGNLLTLGLFCASALGLSVTLALIAYSGKTDLVFNGAEAREAIGAHYGVDYPLNVGIPDVSGQMDNVSLRISGTDEFYREAIITRSGDNVVQVFVPSEDPPHRLVELTTVNK